MSLHLLDPLCCLEDHLHFLEEEAEEEEEEECCQPELQLSSSSQLPTEELRCLLTKQAETHLHISNGYPKAEAFLSWARKEATHWILKASSHLGFTPHTSVLAVDYVDRFLSIQTARERQPWMAQLTAVACLSIAAKVEETYVPLLLDLQVEEIRFVFDAKTVQRMELLVLSTLGWRMNSITPMSFVDHIARRMGSGCDKKLQARCQSVLLSVISDSKWVEFPPSILATSTILFCLEDLGIVCDENQLLSLMNTTMEEVRDCSRFIAGSVGGSGAYVLGRKRKLSPPSPTGVVSSTFSCESSDESWEAVVAVGSAWDFPAIKRPLNRRS